MNDYGSILSGMDGVNSIEDAISDTQTEVDASSNVGNVYSNTLVNLDKMFSEYLDGSTRLMGTPHQFLAHNDNRYGKSNMGRMYAEKIIMEAPTVYIKPGVSEFLPGENSKEKKSFIQAIEMLDSGDASAMKDKLEQDDNDVIQYFGIKPDYSGYMQKVNLLCRMLATMLGIEKVKVPWSKGNVTFATYDWRLYKMSSQYGDLDISVPSPNLFSAFKDFFKDAADSLVHDFEYVQFYVTPDSSFSQSFSNSTTSSVLSSMAEQLQGVAKELQTVSAMTGGDIGNLANESAESLNTFIQKNATDGPIGQMLKRLTGASKQVISGGNFILPEIWSSSSSESSFSFTMHLTTPYGNKLGWFINVGVPMMYALALALPIQQTANVVSSPYLLKIHSPGWFSSSMAIIDSISIEKAADGTWNKAGLPNDVVIRVSIKDLYSALSMPQSNNPGDFMSNTGMLEFLMVSAGVDISRQDFDDKWKIWTALLRNSLSGIVQKGTYDAMMAFKHAASGIFKILK